MLNFKSERLVRQIEFTQLLWIKIAQMTNA